METWNTITLAEIDLLPTVHGIYAFIVDDIIVYIGRSKGLWGRIRRHHMMDKLADIDKTLLKYSTDVDDYDREKELIKEHTPKYNIEHVTKWQ